MNGHGSLRSYLASQIPANASAQIFATQVARDLSAASCQILKVWHRLLTVMSYSCREISTLLRRSWEERMVNSWQQSVIKDPIGRDVLSSEDPNTGENHKVRSEQLRSSDKLRTSNSVKSYLLVEDMALKPDWEAHPILFG